MNITDMIALANREIDEALADAGNDPALLRLPRAKLREYFLLEFGLTLQDIAQAMIERPENLNG